MDEERFEPDPFEGLVGDDLYAARRMLVHLLWRQSPEDPKEVLETLREIVEQRKMVLKTLARRS